MHPQLSNRLYSKAAENIQLHGIVQKKMSFDKPLFFKINKFKFFSPTVLTHVQLIPGAKDN